MKKFIPIALLIISGLTLQSCSESFIKKDDIDYIKEYEKNIYILKEDSGEGARLIKKGEKIKLYTIRESDYIKVYCYPAKLDFLKTERTLILYLFEDDFEKSRFNRELFENKLNEKIEPYAGIEKQK